MGNGSTPESPNTPDGLDELFGPIVGCAWFFGSRGLLSFLACKAELALLGPQGEQWVMSGSAPESTAKILFLGFTALAVGFTIPKLIEDNI